MCQPACRAICGPSKLLPFLRRDEQETLLHKASHLFASLACGNKGIHLLFLIVLILFLMIASSKFILRHCVLAKGLSQDASSMSASVPSLILSLPGLKNEEKLGEKV